MPRWRANRLALRLTLALAAGTACFGIAELAARAAYRHDPSIANHNSSAAWRIIWANRAHRTTASTLDAPLEMHDPLRGWRNRPAFTNTGPLFGAERVTTNAHGARGPIDVDYRRTDARRIVVVGDSFAFGEEVNDEETYAAQLGASLGHTEVINLAVVGYGIDQMLLTITDEALKYSPDLIIVGFISDDIERSLLSFRDFAKPYFVVGQAGRLSLCGTPVAPPDVWLAEERWRSKAIDTLRIIGDDLDLRSGRRRTRAFELTRKLWMEMARVARDSHTEILFVAEPWATEIVLDARPDLVAPGSEAYRKNLDYFTSPSTAISRFGEKLFDDFVAETHVRSLNLGPVFRQRHREGDTRIDVMGHWDAYGHAVAAREIRTKLLADGWADATARDRPVPSGSSSPRRLPAPH